MSDAFEPYQERTFPGRRLIAIGVVPIALVWLASIAGVNFEKAPTSLRLVTKAVVLLGVIVYLIGYWRAVKGKGYHGIIWLAGLNGPIGLVVIQFLPNLNERKEKKA